jgi:hypothetical protein
MVWKQGINKREGRDGRKGREGREGRETEALEPIAELSIRDPVSRAKHIRVESLSLFPARVTCVVCGVARGVCRVPLVSDLPVYSCNNMSNI